MGICIILCNNQQTLECFDEQIFKNIQQSKKDNKHLNDLSAFYHSTMHIDRCLTCMFIIFIIVTLTLRGHTVKHVTFIPRFSRCQYRNPHITPLETPMKKATNNQEA